jgi:hypothetical protein
MIAVSSLVRQSVTPHSLRSGWRGDVFKNVVRSRENQVRQNPGITSVYYNVVRLVTASRYLFYTLIGSFRPSTSLQRSPQPTLLTVTNSRASLVTRRTDPN